MWPILHRELAIRGRSWTTWGLRVSVTFAALMLAALVGVFFHYTRGIGVNSGSTLFTILFYALMLFCLFEGLRTTALGFPEERREGTLGLLFLTPLSSIDVLVGKLTGAALTALYCLIAVIPVLFIPLLLGGLTGVEVFRGFIVLFGTLGLSLACGLLASVNAQDGLESILRSTLWLLALLIFPLGAKLLLGLGVGSTISGFLTTVAAASPILAVTLIGSTGIAGEMAPFWCGQLGTWTLTTGLILLAAKRLGRTWRQDALITPATSYRPTRVRSANNTGDPQSTLASVIARRTSSRKWLWIVLGLTLLRQLQAIPGNLGNASHISMLLFLPFSVIGLVIDLILIHTACRTFAESRQTGEMEILLTTPVVDHEIVRALWLALRPFALGQAAVVIFSQSLILIAQLVFRDPERASPFYFQLGISASGIFLSLFTTYLGSVALIWVGLWKGLTARNTVGAITWTFLMVVILTPVVVMIFGTASGIGLSFTRFFHGPFMSQNQIPIVQFLDGVVMALPMGSFAVMASFAWIRWARQNLNTRFRAEAARVDAVAAGLQLAPPGLPNPSAIPPIPVGDRSFRG